MRVTSFTPDAFHSAANRGGDPLLSPLVNCRSPLCVDWFSMPRAAAVFYPANDV
jgi:hypothetical protein